ncbi:MAG TPA: hypothetical protein DHV72_19065 [Serratia grimesii]|uniref:Uncharacterized protein n=1 Tax=Serratia grimesii TaxID=82995 RepID=A0A9C7V997_9GAMM|nr:hypothetical protein [Serratia grimesii]
MVELSLSFHNLKCLVCDSSP